MFGRQASAVALLLMGCSPGSVDGPIPDASAPVDVGATDGSTPDAPDSHGDADEPDAGDPLEVYDGPILLSETGLYADIATRTLAPGVMPFEVGYELWSDGADKQRWVLLPEGTQIDTRDIDRWSFPIGTRAWKEFRRDGVLVETRFLHKRAEGLDGWLRVAFVWNAAGTDAMAAPAGMPDAVGTAHDVPSMRDCFVCHRGVSDTLIGVSAIQLGTAEGGAFLTALADAGRLSDPPATMPSVPGPPVARDALGFLHGNCGQCHNDDHPLATRRTMRLYLPVGTPTPEESPVYRTAIGAMMSHRIEGTDTAIVPGNPSLSQLYVRISLRDYNQMPPIASEIPSPAGMATIDTWIRSLAP